MAGSVDGDTGTLGGSSGGLGLVPLLGDSIRDSWGEMTLLLDIEILEAADGSVAGADAAVALEGLGDGPLGSEVVVGEALANADLAEGGGNDAVTLEGDGEGWLAAVIQELSTTGKAKVTSSGKGDSADQREWDHNTVGLKDDLSGLDLLAGDDGAGAFILVQHHLDIVGGCVWNEGCLQGSVADSIVHQGVYGLTLIILEAAEAGKGLREVLKGVLGRADSQLLPLGDVTNGNEMSREDHDVGLGKVGDYTCKGDTGAVDVGGELSLVEGDVSATD